MNYLDLIKKLNKNQTPEKEVVEDFLSSIDFELPPEYLSFINEYNGVEGFIGENSYLAMWPIEELLELNKAYEVEKFAPELFLFGSDGGDTAYAFKKQNSSIVEVPFIGMAADISSFRGDSFNGFLEYLYKL